MTALARLARLFRTVRHVPPAAIAWRVWARAKRFYYRLPLYELGKLSREQQGSIDWVGVELIAGDAGRGHALANGVFSFAGEDVQLGVPPRSWLPEKQSALWVFNLHYHEWLADLRAAGKRDLARQLVGDWLLKFASYHPIVWHPYPTSLRLVAWLTHGPWLLEGADGDFTEALTDALERQAEYLLHNCEHDLGGNHLLKNLKALIYAGLALEGKTHLFEQGMAGFLRELKTQIFADGSHYERSPLYQAQVLRDILEVRALLRKHTGEAGPLMDELAMRVGTALATFVYPDGGLALFNDSAQLDPESVRQLLRLSGAGDPVEILPDSGYARLQRGPSVVFFDAGKVGPDENPGHAHADTLSFEFSYGRERVIVNGGTYAYQHRLRQAFRSTALHSTLEVDGENSAEVWGGFRVGRRPQHVTLEMKGVDGGELVVEGSHDGYRHLGVMHGRKLVLAGDGKRLLGEDTLRAVGGLWNKKEVRHRAVAHFHLHPDVQVRLLGEREAELVLGNGRKARFVVDENGRLDVKDSQYAPQFGVLVQTRQLVIHGRMMRDPWQVCWQLIF